MLEVFVVDAAVVAEVLPLSWGVVPFFFFLAMDNLELDVSLPMIC